MEIIKQLSQVMEDVGAVRKTERNTHQSFNFRGIDNVVNAVSPALRKHGVVVVPTVNTSEAETVEIGQNRTRMGYVRVNVTYTFYAQDGSSIATTVCMNLIWFSVTCPVPACLVIVGRAALPGASRLGFAVCVATGAGAATVSVTARNFVAAGFASLRT